MKENDSEKDLFLFIDQDLKAMASDVPEMPDSFRSGWRQAIRNEAGTPSQAPEQIPSESAVPPEKTPAEARVRRPRHWTYLLSAAAALIFLFAGTLATRGMLSPRLKKNTSDTIASSLSAVEEKDGSDAAKKPLQADSALSAVNDADYETESASYEDMYSASEESALSYARMESAEEYEKSSEEEAFPDSGSFFASNADNAVSSQAAGNSERISAENTESTGSVSTAFLSAAATESPASLTNHPPESAPTAQPPAGENSGNEIIWFLEDMGAFVLTALPYMAAAGVLLLIILFIKRKKAKKDEENVQ